MKQIELSKGIYALIDDENFDLVNEYKWYASRFNTAAIKYFGEFAKLNDV